MCPAGSLWMCPWDMCQTQWQGRARSPPGVGGAGPDTRAVLLGSPTPTAPALTGMHHFCFLALCVWGAGVGEGTPCPRPSLGASHPQRARQPCLWLRARSLQSALSTVPPGGPVVPTALPHL